MGAWDYMELSLYANIHDDMKLMKTYIDARRDIIIQETHIHIHNDKNLLSGPRWVVQDDNRPVGEPTWISCTTLHY